MSETFLINVKIQGDDGQFRRTMKDDEKAIADFGKAAKKAEAKLSDFEKFKKNLSGIISDKFNDTGMGKFVGDVTKGTSALDKFLAPAAAVAGGTVAIGAAAVVASAALFGLAKEASDYGSEIADAEAMTGLTAESLSTLRYQAGISGSDFGALTSGISKFSKTVSDAASGSEEAKAKLKALGIDPQDAVNDLDGALSKAFKTINDAKPGVQQMTAAQDAFGKSAVNLIPTITGMNGDFNELKKKAAELGIVLSEEDVKAADAFGDTLDTLSTQAKATSAKFALQFAPEITGAMDDISKFLADNKEDFKDWGREVSNAILSVKLTWSALKAIASNPLNPSKMDDQFGADYQYYIGQADEANQRKADAQFSRTPGTTLLDDNGKAIVRKDTSQSNDGEYDLEKRKSDAEKLAKENAAGRIAIAKAVADGDRQSFENAQNQWVEYYKQNTSLAGAFRDEYLRNEAAFVEKQKELTASEFNQRIIDEKNQLQQKAILIEKGNALRSIEAESKKRIADVDKLITENQKKNSEERLKIAEGEVSRKLEYYKADDDRQYAQLERDRFFQQNGIVSEEAYYERLGVIRRDSLKDEIRVWAALLTNENLTAEKREEIKQRIKILNVGIFTEQMRNEVDLGQAKQKSHDAEMKRLQDQIDKNKELTRSRYAPGTRARKVPGVEVTDATPKGGPGFMDGLMGGDRLAVFTSEADKMKAVYSDLQNTAGAALGSMIDGGAQLLENWILTGEASGAAMAQMTASVIAGVAAQAGVKAIFEVAEGLAALANPFTAWQAPMHFAAAKTYGLVALGAVAVGAGIGAAGGLRGGSDSSDGGSQGYAGQSNEGNYFASDKDQSGTKSEFVRRRFEPFQNQDAFRQTSADSTNQRLEQRIETLSNVIDSMDGKLGSMKEGEVLVRGIRQKRGLIAETVDSELSKNSTMKTKMGRTLGLE